MYRQFAEKRKEERPAVAVAATVGASHRSAAEAPSTPASILAFPRGVKIGICGEIGAGKSTAGHNLRTCLSRLRPELKVDFSEESVPQRLLEKTNQQPTRWSDHFQTIMAMRAATRESLALSAAPDVLFIERPLKENCVFADANVEVGNMSKEYYEEYYRPICTEHRETPELDLIVFLFVTEHTAAQRRDARHRPSEELYNNTYMNALGDAYFRWVVECCSEQRMLVIDWNTDFAAPELLLARIAEALQEPAKLPRIVYQHPSELSHSAEIERLTQRKKASGKSISPLAIMLFEDGVKAPMSSSSEEEEAAPSPVVTYFNTETAKLRRQIQNTILRKLAAGQNDMRISM